MSHHLAFADPPSTAAHFKLYYYAAVLRVIDWLVRTTNSPDSPFDSFPFLTGYTNELAGIGLDGVTTAEALPWWRDRVLDWEARATSFLPIRALRDTAGLDYETLVAYFCVGLSEEDPRFGAMFEAVNGTLGQHYLTYGVLATWSLDARSILRQWQDAHLVRIVNPDAPRANWAVQPWPLLWAAISGRAAAELRATGSRDRGERDRLIFRSMDDLPRLDALILSPELRVQVGRLAPLLTSREVETLVIRGPQHNGRTTLLGAVAAELGRGVLELPSIACDLNASHGSAHVEDPLQLAGPLATLLNAVPIVACELAPGESAELPMLAAYDGPLGVVMGRDGSLRRAGRVLTLVTDMPSPSQRTVHWRQALAAEGRGTLQTDDFEAIVRRFRLTSGAIYRSATLARAWARLRVDTEEPEIILDDVQQATRALNRQALETLAQPLLTAGSWSDLSACTATSTELLMLESRCRQRERLGMNDIPGASPRAGTDACGVRALFTGPSGTGKTLAARILASVLTMDLYRVDLSSVVNKYIGETEKNLNQLLSRAEELDVILLIDEGDALLTQRTSVQTANDRYANLETNFLLQRLESYSGIVVITTNAGDRIDSAFQRRIDVTIEFRPPEPAERWEIWQLHLPREHRVEPRLLREVAERCTLNGGQIRNTVLHASVLALEDGGCITSEHFEAAVRREFRQSGGVYPIRAQHG